MKLGASLRRLIERELVVGLGRRRRRALVERVRGNPEARREWDRALSAFRVVEQREVSRFELDQVERWLFEDLEAAAVVAPAPAGRRRWTWLAGAVASLASAAALVLWLESGEGHDDPGLEVEGSGDDAGLVARGRGQWSRPLAIALVCGQPPRPATRSGCGRDELLGFSARLAPGNHGRAGASLSLFGIDARGELLYYAPTPAELDPELELAVDRGWTALPMSVRLEVNHVPGRVRVFALAGARPPSLAELDTWAEALREQPSAALDDPPWHLRLDRAALAGVCPSPARCASAEAEFLIHPLEGPR